MRIRLLDRLRDGAATVQELQDATGASQQNVSKHLGVLAQIGLVAKSQRGTSAYYRFADDTVYRLCDLVCEQLDRRFADEAAQRRALGKAARAAANRTAQA